MYLYGKNSVIERLKAAPESIRNIYIQKNFNAPDVLKAVRSAGIPLARVTEKELIRIKRADRLQGIIAEVSSYVYTPIESLLYRPEDDRLCFILLDGINDPHNLGSIMRIAACFGRFAIVIPRHGSCEVNETVIHVASGGENFVPVSLVTNLATVLRDAKKAGYWAVGTVVEGGRDMDRLSLPFPLCLVMGSEGKGIRQGLQNLLDLKVSLPMKGAQLSLNVAMAFGIFAHEISKQMPNE
jgi:23S rRNA (guanosine2251-2'-O)-methyltransferase